MDYPGEKLVIRMWDTLVEKGIGKLFAPWQLRRVGRAQADVRRHERLLLTQAERDASDILAGTKTFDSGGLLLPVQGSASDVALGHDVDSVDVRMLAKGVEEVVVGDAIRREVNASKAILIAEELLEQEVDGRSTGEGTPGDDWLYRWRDGAGEVSDGELQRLWGALLAGEFRDPGTYSLRTISFLRNLSQTEAKKIAQLAPFVVGDIVYSGADEILKSHGIDFGFLLEIQNIGVLSGLGGLGLTVTRGSLSRESFRSLLVSHEKALLVTHEDPDKELKLGIYALTDIGKQVVRLGRFEANMPYLTAVGRRIAEMGFKVHLLDAAPMGGGRYNCTNPLELTEEAESEG